MALSPLLELLPCQSTQEGSLSWGLGVGVHVPEPTG